MNEALHRHPSQSARNHAATYARADLVAGTVLWLVALAAVVLIFSKSPMRTTGESPPSGSTQ